MFSSSVSSTTSGADGNSHCSTQRLYLYILSPSPQHLTVMLSQSSTYLLPFPQHLTACILVLPLLMLLAGVCPSWPLLLPQDFVVLPSQSSTNKSLISSAALAAYILVMPFLMLLTGVHPPPSRPLPFPQNLTDRILALPPHTSHRSATSSTAFFNTVISSQSMASTAMQPLCFSKDLPILWRASITASGIISSPRKGPTPLGRKPP